MSILDLQGLTADENGGCGGGGGGGCGGGSNLSTLLCTRPCPSNLSVTLC